jgi:3-dehydroquinate synthase
METVRVALGERAYTIHIGAGALDDARLYAPHVAGRRVAVITNEVVAPLYLERLERALRQAGAKSETIVLPDGEQTKDWPTLERVFERLLAERFGRDSIVVALGGGVIGDLAGFAAAVYQRGVPFVQVPTTLLAQVDSSVGGKTAINHPCGKNMVGAFHQPLAVISDIATLDTLPDRELRAGLAEVIKHGVALDAEFALWLEANMGKLLQRDRAALAHAVRRSCVLKAGVVALDEREAGSRALLNFGHTFGHAIETAQGYGVWLHGEAVAAGMVMAAELSVHLTLLARSDAVRLQTLLERAGLPVSNPHISPARLLQLMRVDKKADRGRLRFVLLSALGQALVRADIDDAAVLATIAACTPPELPVAATQ